MKTWCQTAVLLGIHIYSFCEDHALYQCKHRDGYTCLTKVRGKMHVKCNDAEVELDELSVLHNLLTKRDTAEVTAARPQRRYLQGCQMLS